MFTFILSIVGMFFKGPLQRIFDTVDKKMDNETERERIKSDVLKTYVTSQASVLIERTWWFQLLFVIPLGVYWTTVLFYSILFCQKCVAGPVDWSIAALPPPFDAWAGGIIGAIFLIRGGSELISRYKR